MDLNESVGGFPPEEVRSHLLGWFHGIRRLTETICEPLEPEDFVVQSMPDASPAKWHLAHTTWFFETFVLGPALRDYRPFRPEYAYLFNSYYNAVGERIPRPRRGLLSRPTTEEIFRYRKHVDQAMLDLIQDIPERTVVELWPTIILGLNHEQQHQELILTDIKHAFAGNPLRPAYREKPVSKAGSSALLAWIAFLEGARWIGHVGPSFSFDNEEPRHREYLEPYQLATRLVTNSEYLAFIDGGGYSRPELWLSDGWNTRCEQRWESPLYWEKTDTGWSVFTLAGMQPLDESEPVCHVSFYEADAFARWAEARLPSEAEWESAAERARIEGNLLDGKRLHPMPAQSGSSLRQLFGDVWEWTRSPYVGYPGFVPNAGALGEYNGKFMCNQFVLRGGSCVTPSSHIRPTYRNFFPPDARWQLSGIRLAKDGG
jgi:ergothioneine biosynthesis protein EgtB